MTAQGPQPQTDVQVGFWISSEEHGPKEMIRAAQRAEAVGSRTCSSPITSTPGPIGRARAHSCGRSSRESRRRRRILTIGTGVTCPIIRTHPAIVAQAVATSAVMLDGRFFLGVGTGENLNEHITGAKWPPLPTRRAMLEEAIELMRLLFRGGERSFRGRYFTLEDARLYTRTEAIPPIYVASGGPKSAALAARIGDGLIATTPNRALIQKFEEAGGKGEPRHIEIQVCWGRDAAAARRLAYDLWRIGALGGQPVQELRRPADFEAATAPITMERATQHTPVGPNPEPYVNAIRTARNAGFDHIGLHQIGPDQDGFLSFWEKELQPALARQAQA